MVKLTLDQKTYNTIVEALTDAGGVRGLPVSVGDNELILEDARELWYLIRVFTAPVSALEDEPDGSPQSYLGVLRDHSAARLALEQLARQGAADPEDPAIIAVTARIWPRGEA